ncbi:MAG: hypothetical protein QN174_11280 [Armatimonadota bacterium]|nr:hypothetical protein [Armatimonadota bacterium]MDR7421837.1 hypothetical protein [Armatimonadota bacterium]MDR7455455.1 hypothetical protein [Armatimonadota bacterium]MDR7457743.1 hypothetical protein [Armatimonadota bacterium]MDR7497526.1 hypothetical protein [Armatimonadota bacterium]
MPRSWIVCLVVAIALAAAPAVPAAPAAAFQGDPAAIAELQAALEKFNALRTWRARMTLAGQSVAPIIISSAGPDRTQMTIGAGGAVQQMYILEGIGTWVQQGTQCSRLPGGTSAPGPSRADADPSARREGTVTVTRGDRQILDGVPTQTYLMTVEAQGRRSQLKYYIDPAITLPKRMEIQSERGTLIFDYYDYNAPIVINNPPC